MKCVDCNEEFKYLKERLLIRRKIFMDWAFADKRLVNDIFQFMKDTKEIEERIIDLKREFENEEKQIGEGGK